MSAGSSRPFTSGSGGTSGRQRVIVCYNCKGEGHMAKQCTKPKRKRDAEWFKDKVLLVQAQASGQVLQEEELDFLARVINQSNHALAEVHNHDNVNTNMINQDVQEMPSSEQSNVVNHLETEITSAYSQVVVVAAAAVVVTTTTPVRSMTVIMMTVAPVTTLLRGRLMPITTPLPEMI
nr:retrovirus-related Pol polyprotein from transposon TNT 1-94 [Tanacetum cinerariifolium]